VILIKLLTIIHNDDEYANVWFDVELVDMNDSTMYRKYIFFQNELMFILFK